MTSARCDEFVVVFLRTEPLQGVDGRRKLERAIDERSYHIRQMLPIDH